MACLADNLPAQVKSLRLVTNASRLGEGAMRRGPGFPRVLVAPGAAIPSGTHTPFSCRRKTVQQMSILSVMQREAKRQGAETLAPALCAQARAEGQRSQCRLPPGHVADNVIGRAHCAVLIVATQEGAGDSSPDATGAAS